MSIINDMLKDLDARRTAMPRDRVAALHLTEPTDGARHRRVMIISATVLLVAILLSFAWISNVPASISSIFETGHNNVPGDIEAATEDTGKLPAEINQIAQPVENATAAAMDKIATASAQTRRQQPATSEPMPVTDNNSKPQQTNVSTADTDADLQHERGIQTTGQLDIRVRQQTPASRAVQLYKKAVRAMSIYNHDKATGTLEELLVLDPDHHEARVLLASLYIRQQQPALAEQLLEEALLRHPAHVPYARLLARLLVTTGEHGRAIEHLETALAGAARDAEDQALLAGLYQHTGNADAAIYHYKSALGLKPGRGEWWMGLGISHEQAGNSSAAHTAYRKALELPLETALLEYINRRMRQLSNS